MMEDEAWYEHAASFVSLGHRVLAEDKVANWALSLLENPRESEWDRYTITLGVTTQVTSPLKRDAVAQYLRVLREQLRAGLLA